MQLAASVSTSSENAEETNGPSKMSLHVLGQITKKVVVTPDFDIGVRHTIGGVAPSSEASRSHSVGDSFSLSGGRVKVED